MAEPYSRESELPRRALLLLRWVGFIPAAWETWRVHGLMLKALGVPMSDYAVVVNDSDLLAWAVAGLVTPLCVVAVGAWVYPGKTKIWPVLILCAFCIYAGASNLHHAGAMRAIAHPLGLGGILMIVTSAAMAAAWSFAS